MPDDTKGEGSKGPAPRKAANEFVVAADVEGGWIYTPDGQFHYPGDVFNAVDARCSFNTNALVSDGLIESV